VVAQLLSGMPVMAPFDRPYLASSLRCVLWVASGWLVGGAALAFAGLRCTGSVTPQRIAPLPTLSPPSHRPLTTCGLQRVLEPPLESRARGQV